MKFKLPPLTDHQKLIIHLHEQGHITQNKMNKEAGEKKTFEQIKAEHQKMQQDYFDNFPFDIQATRDFLGCLKDGGYYKDINPQEAPLNEMIYHPDSRVGGIRILNVTVGKGTHNTMMYGGHELLDHNFEVNEGEVYVTYNTQYSLSGGIFTCIMQKENGKNKITKRITHSRS